MTPVLGLLAALSYRKGDKKKYFCASKRKLKLATFVPWLTSLLLGGLLYFVLNWNLIFS